MQLTSVLAAIVVAGGSSAPAVAMAAAPPALAVVFHIKPPASIDPALAAADVALRAPQELGEPLRAMRGHTGARLSFAVDPAYLSSLDRAATGDFALATAAAGTASPAGQQSAALLQILARHRPLGAALSRSRAGARYLTLATAAANELSGNRSVPFTSSDLADFASTDAQVVLAASGIVPLGTASQTSANAVAALARADKAIEDDLKTAVSAGSVELIASPDGEPVLPLLIDGGGKSTADPFIVSVGARADAQWLTTDAVRSVAAFTRSHAGVGLYSPYGAYDDATGVVAQSSGAAFAMFSDRVVRGAGSEGSEGGIDAARAAALHAYALTVSKGVTMPIVFWSQTESDDVQTASGSETAMAERLAILARIAADRARATSTTSSIFVLRIEAQGPWSQRPDARAVMGRVVAEIASGRSGVATTPGAFVRSHRPTATAYGYPPAAESGSFAFWMGSPNQASMWKALVQARKAAGGDAAFARPQLRSLITAAEAGEWYSILEVPLPGGVMADRLDAFRSLIGSVYRAAGATPPDVIAPLRLAAPTAAPSPVPSATPTP
jgi:hypothetical protein